MQELLGTIFKRNWFFGDPELWTLSETIQLTIRKMHYEIFPTRDSIVLLVFISSQFLEYIFNINGLHFILMFFKEVKFRKSVPLLLFSNKI